MHQGLGGKAANQAVAAARLGGEVSLIGAVGNDPAGVFVLQRLAAEGVDVGLVRRDANDATGTVVLQKDDDGHKQTAVFSGANAGVTPEHIDAAADAIRAARVVLVQLEIPLDTVARVLHLARSSSVPVILDPSPVRSLPPDLVRGATIVKPNAIEARALTGIEVTDVDSARRAAARLLEMGVETVAIEAGSAGNLFCTGGEEVFVPLFEVDSVDATGAGDTLVGALAVAMTESRSLRSSARLATAAAALATRSFGAQTAMPRREEVEELLRTLGRPVSS